MINQDKWAELERELLEQNLESPCVGCGRSPQNCNCTLDDVILIEYQRGWEAQAKRQHRENLLKWGLLVMAVSILVVLALVATSHGSELPPAPHLAMRHDPVETYEPDQRMIVHNYPNGRTIIEQPRLVDWSFVLGHGVYAASSAFDNWETARNLGACAFEGNDDLGRNPSSGRIAVHAVVEAGAVVGGDLLLKWIGRRQGLPRWANAIGGNMAAMIGTGKHVHGGVQWQRLCN